MKDLTHLQLEKPPEILVYATNTDLCDDAFRNGVKRKKKTFIELYENEDDARRKVRKKQAFLFAVMTEMMAEDGYNFYHAETGEWLTDELPKKYIRFY